MVFAGFCDLFSCGPTPVYIGSERSEDIGSERLDAERSEAISFAFARRAMLGRISAAPYPVPIAPLCERL